MDNLEEMGKFSERHSLPKLNQEEIENMNKSITCTEMESVILKLPTNRSSEPDDFNRQFLPHHFQMKLTLEVQIYFSYVWWNSSTPFISLIDVKIILFKGWKKTLIKFQTCLFFQKS